MRSTHSFAYIGFHWNPDAEQPSLPDLPCTSPLDDEEAQQREFVEEIYRDLGVGD